MPKNFHLDSLDKKILSLLSKNARMSYLEVARNCNVSGAAIHQRIQRMLESKIIKGSQIIFSYQKAGYLTCAYISIGINLISPTTHEEVFRKITMIPEITECHHVTGKYSLLIKIYAKSNEHLKEIIVQQIQSIAEITSTETIISLEEGFTRQLPIE
ncbi:MAG: Lrp/AsnC ligand binding domain-containing protein [Bacteroidota bacterium]|nr:Lrp/AsnC ligand binding domain-containing protein [Bacteroidota bacterium]